MDTVDKKITFRVLRTVPAKLYEEYYAEMHPNWKQVLEKLPSCFAHKGHFYLVAFRDGQAVGFASARKSPLYSLSSGMAQHYFDVTPVFISSEFRGKGIAPSILRELSFYAKKRGHNFLIVREANAEMISATKKARLKLMRNKKFMQNVGISYVADPPAIDVLLNFGPKQKKENPGLSAGFRGRKSTRVRK